MYLSVVFSLSQHSAAINAVFDSFIGIYTLSALVVNVMAKDVLLVVSSVDYLVLDGHDETFCFWKYFASTEPQVGSLFNYV